MDTYVSNHRQSFSAPAGTFMLEQKNAGFVENDGRWILAQLPESTWVYGQLRITRKGRVVGVFDTEAEARIAASAIDTSMPSCDEPAIMGRVSC